MRSYNKQEKYNRIIAETEVFRAAKKNTISYMGRIGRKHKYLKYPIFFITVLFIFVYNLLLHAFIAMKMKEKLARVMAMAMVAVMVLTSVDVLAFAAYGNEEPEFSVTEIVPLPDNIANQRLCEGNAEEEITFPTSLVITAEYEVSDEADSSNEEPEAEDAGDEESEEGGSEQEGTAGEDSENESPEENPQEEETPDEAMPSDEESQNEVPSESENAETEQVDEIPDLPAESEETTVPEDMISEETIPETTSEPLSDDITLGKIANEFISAFRPLSAYAEELDEENSVSRYVTETKEVEVSWKLDKNLSSERKISKGKPGDIYVYYPELPDNYICKEDVTLPIITVTIVAEPVVLETQSGNILITLEAAAGVFPHDAVLSAERISDKKSVKKIDSLVEKNEEDEEVRKTIAFDINVLNENGEAIQPEIPEDMPVSEAITLTFKKIVRELSEESTHEKEESIQAFTISDDLTDMETVTAEVGRSDVSIHPEHFTIYGVVLLASGSSSPVTFANGGYPYGKAMSSSAITLAVDIASGTPSTYQWQSSTDKTNWTNMTGAASDTVSFTPASGTWYRCVVNDTESMPVQAVYPGSDGRTWTGNMNSFYITNGYVAYMINGSSFDVTGLYEKGGVSYMLQTSYSTNWAVSGAYDKIYASFSNTNQYQIEFTVQLSSTTTQFGFGCDTQLGDYTTSGSYSDWAALIAYLNDDKSLKQIAMMGSASEESAEDDDPAFVIAPVTGNALFWIGRYSSRQMFAYNTSVLSGCRTTEINGQNVATAVENTDSGMTMSWVGLTAGSRISFNFGVGSVANTGAKKAHVVPTSNSLTIPETDPNCYYALFVKGETEPVIEWIPGNGGELVFDNLESNTEYVVKVITKEDYEKNKYDDSADTDVITAIDPLKPDLPTDPEEEVAEVSFSILSRSITCYNLNKNYTYNLVGTNGGNIYSSFLSTDSEGKLVFANLNPGTVYYMIAKTPQNTLSDRIEKKTLPSASFVANGHGTAPATIYDIEMNGLLEAPESPTEIGWGFAGWYRDAACTDSARWDFENDTVSDNIVLYAKWMPHQHEWTYVQTSVDVLLAYCSNDDANGKCDFYGTSAADATCKVQISAKDTAYTGESYNKLTVHDTLVAADAFNNSKEPVVYYTDSSYTIPTTPENDGADAEGGAPVNVGKYYAKIVIDGQNESSFSLKTSFSISVKTLSGVNLFIDPSRYTADGSEIYAEYHVKDGDRVLSEGVDYEVTEESVVSSSEVGNYSITINGINNYVGTATKHWKIADATPPAGIISVEGMDDSTEFISDISFDHYFNSLRKVSILAEDAESVADELKIEYYVSTVGRSEHFVENLGETSWKTVVNGGSFNISKDGEYVVYAKIQDPSGNISYISSDGFCIDTVRPVIAGIKNDSKFCKDAFFRATDKGSGIATLMIDGTDVYDVGTIDYVINGDNTLSTEEHTIVVTDKAGNSATVSGIRLNVESEHEWKNEKVVKEPSCTKPGEETVTCSKCGTEKHIDIDPLGHDFDYSAEDDSAWDIVWTVDNSDDETGYVGTVYLHCSRGCGEKTPVTDTVTGSIVINAVKVDVDEETIRYEITVHYDADGDSVTRTFTKTASKTLLEQETVAGDNTIGTELIVSEDSPEVSVDGLDKENALDSITQSERAKLEDEDSGFSTKIVVYMEVQNIDGTLEGDELEGLLSNLVESLGTESENVVLLDMSLYKQLTTENPDGVETDKVVEKLSELANPISISFNVDSFGFPEVAAGKERVYAVSRNHDYSDLQDGSGLVSEIVYEGKAENGVITVDSDLFCAFAVGYKDVAKAKKPKPTEPEDDPDTIPDQESGTPWENPANKEEPDEIETPVKPVKPVKPNRPSETDITEESEEELAVAETSEPEETPDAVIDNVVAENDSEEIINPAEDTDYNRGGTIEKEKKNCNAHWWNILVFGLFVAAAAVLRKKPLKYTMAALGLDVAAGILITVLGKCSLDVYMFATEVVLSLLVMAMLNKKAIKNNNTEK